MTIESLGIPDIEEVETTPSTRRRVARLLLWIATIAILAGAGYIAYGRLRTTQPGVPPVTTVPARVDSLVAVVDSSGQIAPWNQAKLSFPTAGKVAAIPVRVGDQVKKGDVVARLETTALEIQLEQAKGNLAVAETKLAAIKQGARPEEIAIAQAALDAAQAKLDGELAGGRPEDVQAAGAVVAQAQARLTSLQHGALPADLVAAKSAVVQAQAQLDKDQATVAALQRGPDPATIHMAELAVEEAKTKLWAAQHTRDALCGTDHTDIIPPFNCSGANISVGANQLAVDQAATQLQQLQQGAKPQDIAAAKALITTDQAQLATAQARLAQLQAGASPADLAQATAAVQGARDLQALKAHPYTAADIAQQRQAVVQAQADLALKKNPFTDVDLSQARALVDQAKAQVDLAAYNLSTATLVAPFDGVVSAVTSNVGELTGTANAGPVVSLVDPTNVRLDLSVDETDIGNVQIGQSATATFDARPGKTFDAKVIAISPSAAVNSGVATYTVSLLLQNAAGLRPGMTGNAQIIYARRDNVVVVPNQAVRTEGDHRVASVLDGTKVVARVVSVGIVGSQYTEITSGLRAGEALIIPSTQTNLPLTAGDSARQ